MKIMKNIASSIFYFGLMCYSAVGFSAVKVIDNIAALVNNDVILESDMRELIDAIKQNVSSLKELPSEQELRHQALERLIMESLILQEAAKYNVKISDQDLDNTIAGIAAQHGLSIDELRGELATQKISYTNYRNNISKQMLMETIRNNVIRSRINISPQEVNSLATQLASTKSEDIQINLSQILISLPQSPNNDDVTKAQDLMKKVLTELSKNTSFSNLARTYSTDPETALNGGEMGWLRRSELPNAFAEALKNPQKGEIVGPIRTAVGIHLLRVNNVRQADHIDYDAVSATEYHARHILIRPNVINDTNAAQSKLEEIRNDIIEGVSTFQLQAEQFSDDTQSAVNGGDLGWSLPDRYEPNFKAELIKLEPGEISQPFESQFGWHIIQLVDKRKVDRASGILEEEAKRLIFNRKFTEEVQNWMQELRAGAYIKILDEDLQ